MPNQDKYKQLDAWLEGELGPNEKEVFEHQMQSDPELAAEARFQQDLNNALREKEVFQFRNALETARQTYYAEQDEQANLVNMKPKEAARIFPMRRILALAAGLALLVTVAIWLMREPSTTNPEALFANNFTPPSQADFVVEPGIEGGRSEQTMTEIEQRRKDAMSAYGRKDYAVALSILKDIPIEKLSLDELRVHYYQLGVLYLIAGNDAKANELLSMENAAEAESRQWYRALILLKQKAPKETLEVAFSKMAESPTHPWNKEANAVLVQIKKMD